MKLTIGYCTLLVAGSIYGHCLGQLILLALTVFGVWGLLQLKVKRS